MKLSNIHLINITKIKVKEYVQHIAEKKEFIVFIPFLPNANVRFLKMAVMSW